MNTPTLRPAAAAATSRKKPPPKGTKTVAVDVKTSALATTLRQALAVWAHELVYQRHIYPRRIFAKDAFFGVHVHTCRVPQVVQYIQAAVQLAVAAILDGAADELAWSKIRLSDDNDNDDTEMTIQTIETFRLKFSSIPQQMDETLLNDSVLPDWERQLRNLVLSVLSLPRSSARAKTGQQQTDDDNEDSLSFRMQLHLCSAAAESNCSELHEAFQGGSWRESTLPAASQSIKKHHDGSRRNTTTASAPLFHVDSPAGRVDFVRERKVFVRDIEDI